MRHARSDYDAIQPWGTKQAHIAKLDGVSRNCDEVEHWETDYDFDPIIPEDEPVFLIRGQDRAAIPAAEAWCEAAEADPSLHQGQRPHDQAPLRMRRRLPAGGRKP